MEENKGHQKDLERNVFGISMILAEQLKENQKFTEPDYWEKLKHQAAISAMQGILSNEVISLDFESENSNACIEAVAIVSVRVATALVNKLKGE